MGRVINIDNMEGESASVLTETGKGGLISSGYLRDEPAGAHLQDETPVFVLTNQKRGVEVDRNGERDHVKPGSGYRTITVVTDRRILVLVGDSSHENVDGDQRIAIPFTDVESVTSDASRRGGSLTVTRTGDISWRIHTAGSGLDAVVKYVETAIDAWEHVETTVDDVKRALVSALDYRERGEYDDALDAAQAAVDQLEDAVRTADSFTRKWPGTAMADRVREIDHRCQNTLAKVRISRARRFTDTGERRWRDEAYESAHDDFDRAAAEYDAILSQSTEPIEDRDRVEAEARRVARLIDQLAEAPLRQAIEADKVAEATDDPAAAADSWEDAIEHYRTAIDVDGDVEERRFSGEPAQIRDRLDEVVEKITSARRNAAKKAKQAGNWYIGTDQYDIAIEEFETAREQFERAITVARDHYPDAVDHLEADLDAVEDSIERARAARDGEPIDPAETPATEDEPDYDVEATIGNSADARAAPSEESDSTGVASEETEPDDGPARDEATASGPATGQETRTDATRADVTPNEDTRDTSDTVEASLKRLDRERFTDVVVTVLSETGWELAETDDTETITVRKESPGNERMIVRVSHRPHGRPVEKDVVDTCSELRRDSPDVDAVMVATSGGITDEATRHSRRRQVRLLDDECLSAVIESRGLEHVLDSPCVEAD